MIATKYRAVNLVTQLSREKSPKMRSFILGCVSTFVKGNNFPGKVQFIVDVKGLDKLIEWTCLDGGQELVLFG